MKDGLRCTSGESGAADPRASYNPICVRKHKYMGLFIQTLQVLDTATSNSSPVVLRTALLFYRLNCFQERHARGEQTCPSSASCYGKSQTFATTERNPGVPTPSFRNGGLSAKLAPSPLHPSSPHPSAHPKLTSRPRDRKYQMAVLIYNCQLFCNNLLQPQFK